MEKVTVLLSTYNGERFLEEQLESLMAQIGVEVNILVRDDGSTDGTQDILEKWQGEGKLTWYQGENIGWAMSFMNLVHRVSNTEYYAFCDQDDIWMPEKLMSAIMRLKDFPNEPCLYFSNLDCWKDGRVIGKAKRNKMWFDRYTCLLQCQAYGCTMVFNKELLKLIRKSGDKNIYAHDFWTFQVAMFTGKVYYDKDSHILYRQHSLNQIGANRSIKDLWKRRWHNLMMLNKDHKRETLAQILLENLKDTMTNENVKIVSVVANYRKNIKDYLKLLFSKKYIMDKPSSTRWLKLRVLIRKI